MLSNNNNIKVEEEILNESNIQQEESLFLEKPKRRQGKKSVKLVEEPIIAASTSSEDTNNNNDNEEEEEEADDEYSADDISAGTHGSNPSRQWQKDDTFNNQAGYCISVGITTRDESLPIYDTPCKMYSSLRYKLQYKCVIVTSGLSASSTPKLLMCRVTVIDEETSKEIKKDNKPIIDDSLISLKCTSTNATAGQSLVFEANHKIKFKSVSFHHNKSKWRLLLQLFSDSNQSINTPVLVIKSAPFQVYARRPKVSERDSTNGLLTSTPVPTSKEEKKQKKKKNELKKRKRSASMASKDIAPPKIEKPSTDEETNAPTIPIVSTESCIASSSKDTPIITEPTIASSSTSTTTSDPTLVKEEPISHTETKTSIKQKKKLLDNFSKTLDTLLKFHSEMDDDSKRLAFEMLQQRMYNHFYSDLVQQHEWMAQQMAIQHQHQQMQDNLSPQNIETDHAVLEAGSADDIIVQCDNESTHYNDHMEHDHFLNMCDSGSFEDNMILHNDYHPFI